MFDVTKVLKLSVTPAGLLLSSLRGPQRLASYVILFGSMTKFRGKASSDTSWMFAAKTLKSLFPSTLMRSVPPFREMAHVSWRST